MKRSNATKAIAFIALTVIVTAAITVIANPFALTDRAALSTNASTPTIATSESRKVDFFNLQQILSAKEGDVIGIRGEALTITDGVKHLVPLNKIVSGGPPPDGIPSIDNPKFISANEADRLLSEEDFVLGVLYDGIARAYPHQILVQHEIVNDDFNGKSLLVTYCPLCFTGIAFEPIIDGEPVEFGTSGKLYNSDLVMYDRKTRSYWSQITGQAIKGELTGLALKKVPLDTIRWGDWKKLHPDTQVLSRDTGFNRAYGQDPYGGYYVQGGPIFAVDSQDFRLPPKAIVYGIFEGGFSKAYPEEAVAEAGGIVNDVLGSLSLLVVQDPDQITKPHTRADDTVVSNRVTRVFDRTLDGVILEFEIVDKKLVDKQTGSLWSFEGKGISGLYAGKELVRIPSSPEFWFARSSFYPDTQIFKVAPAITALSVKDLDNAEPRVIILSQQLQPDGHLSRIVGELQNVGPNILKNVTLSTTIRTGAGSPLLVELTPPVVSLVVHPVIEELLPGQKSPFEFLYTGVATSATDVQVLSYEVADSAPYLSLRVSNVTSYLDPGVAKPSSAEDPYARFYGPIPSFHVIGMLENDGLSTASHVKVVVTFYNKEGEMVDGVFWFTDPFTLKPAQTGDFEIVTRLRAAEIASFTVQYTMQTNS